MLIHHRLVCLVLGAFIVAVSAFCFVSPRPELSGLTYFQFTLHGANWRDDFLWSLRWAAHIPLVCFGGTLLLLAGLFTPGRRRRRSSQPHS